MVINDKEAMIYKRHISGKALVWKICICKTVYCLLHRTAYGSWTLNGCRKSVRQSSSCVVCWIKNPRLLINIICC